MKIHHVQGIVVVVAMMCAAVAHAREYTTAKELLLQAIDAPDGRANGVISGPIAAKFSEMTKSKSPVIAEVTTIKSFKQEGCKQLNIKLSQSDVRAKGGKTGTFAIDYKINLCRDGSPPIEGMDLEKVGKVLEHGVQ